MPEGLRIVIGEDDVLLREGIARLLDGGGLRRRGAAPATPTTSCARRSRTAPTSRSSTSRCRRATRTTACGRRWSCATSCPDTGVLVLSQFYEESYALDLIGDRAEGVGYLLKERVGDVDAFVDAVQRVAAGGSALDPEIVGRMLGRRRADGPLDELTPREREVLAAMAEGKSNPGIAERSW